MSLTSAMSNALSGLSVGARLAEVASNNIANALTEGFSKRQAEVSGRTVGGAGLGVRVVSVERHVNQSLVQDLRVSKSSMAALTLHLTAMKAIEAAIGNPSDGASLSGRLAALDRSLVEAAAKPESEVLLRRSLDAAEGLSLRLGLVSSQIADIRKSADRSIAADVGTLNQTLQGVRDLNSQIAAMAARGLDFADAADQRQSLVDRISALVPVRELARDNNQIALITTTGFMLLDGRATVFSFEPAAFIGPADTIGGGELSGLIADGKPVPTAPGGGRLGPGKLSATFELRDEVAVRAQTDIDVIARNLIERFSGTGVDPTLASEEPGLFVDKTAIGLPLDAPGLASRIGINPALSDDPPANIWKLRDGIHSTLDLTRADASLLQRMSKKLAGVFGVSGAPAAPPASLATLAANTLSLITSQRVSAESEVSFVQAQSEALKTELLKSGVDSDHEIQDLMQIEKAYAANARVIQTIDDMLRNLLEI